MPHWRLIGTCRSLLSTTTRTSRQLTPPMSTGVIDHLFANNTPPLPPEAQHIQNEIDGLTEAIAKLQVQLSKLQRRRQNYRVLLSPLRRIPPELLGEIFAFTPRYA